MPADKIFVAIASIECMPVEVVAQVATASMQILSNFGPVTSVRKGETEQFIFYIILIDFDGFFTFLANFAELIVENSSKWAKSQQTRAFRAWPRSAKIPALQTTYMATQNIVCLMDTSQCPFHHHLLVVFPAFSIFEPMEPEANLVLIRWKQRDQHRVSPVMVVPNLSAI